MFETNYYCLVAGLKEYSLDADFKGFDLGSIREEILESLSKSDAEHVRLLYGYYDCENLIALRANRSAYNPLGNLPKETLQDAMQEPEAYLPKAVAKVIRAYNNPEGEEAEEVDIQQRFEKSILEAYYAACASSKCRFIREWGAFDRTLRNISAAVAARSAQREIEHSTIGEGDIVDQLHRSSAADFGLRGELSYVDAVLAAVNDEQNLVEKEHKIDMIRWNESIELTSSDYFNVNAVLAYLVRVNIVARWSLLDKERGRQMFHRLLQELDAKEMINKQ